MTKKIYKLNLHTHTKYSDGENTIEEMAIMAKNLGHCTLVITDHYYGRPDLACYSLTKESYLQQREEAKKVSKKLRFPIIVGIECGYNSMEEINVFGHKAIMYLFDNGVAHWNFEVAREKYNCAMILNHPSLSKSLEAGVHKVIDGFEYYNSGQNMFRKDWRQIPEEFKHLHKFSNGDSHQIASLDRGFNLFSMKVSNEKQLIQAIKEGPELIFASGDLIDYYEIIKETIF